jgi:hypothetical protein
MLVWGVVRPRSGRIISHSSFFFQLLNVGSEFCSSETRFQTSCNRQEGWNVFRRVLLLLFRALPFGLGFYLAVITSDSSIHRQPLHPIRRTHHVTFTNENKGIKRDAIFGIDPDANIVFTTFHEVFIQNRFSPFILTNTLFP